MTYQWSLHDVTKPFRRSNERARRNAHESSKVLAQDKKQISNRQVAQASVKTSWASKLFKLFSHFVELEKEKTLAQAGGECC